MLTSPRLISPSLRGSVWPDSRLTERRSLSPTSFPPSSSDVEVQILVAADGHVKLSILVLAVQPAAKKPFSFSNWKQPLTEEQLVRNAAVQASNLQEERARQQRITLRKQEEQRLAQALRRPLGRPAFPQVVRPAAPQMSTCGALGWCTYVHRDAPHCYTRRSTRTGSSLPGRSCSLGFRV